MTVQRTGASRFAQRQIKRQWRLAPVADLCVRRNPLLHVPVETPSEVVERIARHPEGFAGVFGRMQYVPFLPLLELSHTIVRQDLKQAFVDCGLTDSDYLSVSMSELVAFALCSCSDHWAGLAVRWLADGFPIDEAIAGAGDEMIRAKRGSQANRHALFRMIRRWERDR